MRWARSTSSWSNGRESSRRARPRLPGRPRRARDHPRARPRLHHQAEDEVGCRHGHQGCRRAGAGDEGVRGRLLGVLGDEDIEEAAAALSLAPQPRCSCTRTAGRVHSHRRYGARATSSSPAGSRPSVLAALDAAEEAIGVRQVLTDLRSERSRRCRTDQRDRANRGRGRNGHRRQRSRFKAPAVRWAEQDQAQYAEAPAQAPPPASPVEQLKELGSYVTPVSSPRRSSRRRRRSCSGERYAEGNISHSG